MTITSRELESYRRQASEIKAMLKSIRRNIVKRDHKFYFSSYAVYGRVFTLFYNLIRNGYVFESIVQPPQYNGIAGHFMNLRSACFDLERRCSELVHIEKGNYKHFARLIADLATQFYSVLTISKNKSL